jgi:hypothetical protein
MSLTFIHLPMLILDIEIVPEGSFMEKVARLSLDVRIDDGHHPPSLRSYIINHFLGVWELVPVPGKVSVGIEGEIEGYSQKIQAQAAAHIY